MIKKYLPFLLILFISLHAKAQFKVFFYVTDPNKSPLDLVGISIDNLKTGDNVFSQTVEFLPYTVELEAGTYQLTATKFGYLQHTDTLLVTEDNQIKTIILQPVETKVRLGGSLEKQIRLLPNLITVISKDEIDQLGSRDIVELLRNIPGIDYGCDVEGMVGFGMRGVWAVEGKMLVLLDGVQMTEELYASNIMSGRYSVDNIERLEIVRGAASTLYGGFASYGVINIVTRRTASDEGLRVSNSLGHSSKNLMRNYMSASLNRTFEGGLGLQLSAFSGRGALSERDYTDFENTGTYNMYANSRQANDQLSLGLTYKNFRLNLLHDNFRNDTRDAYGANTQKPYQINYFVRAADLSADLNAGKRVTITPRLLIREDMPWTGRDEIDSVDQSIGYADLFDTTRVTKMLSSINTRIQAGKSLNISLLAQYEKNNHESPTTIFFNGSNDIQINNLALAANGELSILGPSALNRGKALNLYFGARWDRHTYYQAFVPRTALTWINGIFHMKALASRAFRVPVIYNFQHGQIINGVPQLKPEFSNTYELEFGLTKSTKMDITASAFLNKTAQTIIYVGDITGEYYSNSAPVGTMGVELFARLQPASFLRLIAGFGYYSPNTQDTFYRVPEQKANYGLSPLKGNLSLRWDLEKLMNLSRSFFSISYLYQGVKYGFKDTTGVQSFKPGHFLNLTLDVKNIAGSGFDAGIGVYDVMNTGLTYVQAYDGGHAPLPGAGREILLRFRYNIGFQ
ncbi:MAG: TonB-dependent receptor [Bacteroidetes bacterium]|nr:TonB-dependent receptor [Bacteroidota bacterium]